MAGGVQKVTLRGTPLDVLCDLLPVFEHVDQLVCLNIKDPQEVGLAMLPTTTRLQHTICSSATCDCIIVYIYHGQFRHLHLQLLFLRSVHLNVLDPLCIPVQLSVKFSTTLTVESFHHFA